MAGSFWPTVSVQINFSGSTWTDVTAYVQAIVASRGRKYELDDPRAGTLTIQLDNKDGRFDPSNTSSPYNPNVLLYKQIRVVCTQGSFSNTIWAGYVERWPQTYRDMGNWQTTPLQAVDVLGALKQKTFLPLAEEMISQQGPTLWWPLTQAAPYQNTTPERVSGIRNGNVVTFGGSQQVSLGANPNGYPAPGIEGGGASFTPADPGYAYPHNMSVVRLETPQDGQFLALPSQPWTLCMMVQTTARPSNIANHNPMCFLEFTDSGGSNAQHSFSEFLRFEISSRGNLIVVAVDQDQAIFNTEYVAQLADGNPHWLSIELSTPSGGAPTLYYSQDNLGVATISSGNPNGWRWDQLVAMQLGGTWPTNANAANSFSGVVGQVVFFPGKLVTTAGQFSGGPSNNLPNAVINAFYGQTGDARVSTIMSLAGYGSKYTSGTTGKTVFQELVTGGKDAASLIIDVAKADGSTIFVRGDGQLVYAARHARYNATPSLTIGDGTNYPIQQLEFGYDTTQLITQAEVSRSGGNSWIVNNTNAQANYGTWSKQISSEPVAFDTHTLAQAQYLSTFLASPKARVEKLVLDAGSNQNVMNLVTGAAGLAALEINQLIKIQHTPLGGAAVNKNVWVESMTFRIMPDEFTITLDASPQDTNTYLTTDLSGTSTLDTANNQLGY